MSTIKVSNVQNPSAASAAITLDANGQATLNGLAYPTSGSLSGRNRIINGDMRIDQRNAGASGTATGYNIDRWAYYATQASKGTWQQNAGSVTPPSGFKNYLGFTSSSAYSVLSGDYFLFETRIEGYNVADLMLGTASAATFTISFWVRSSLTGTFGGSVCNDGASRAYPFSYTISAANTWEYKTVTIAGDTTGTWLTTNGAGLNVRLGLGVGSTYSGTSGSWAGSNFISATGATSVVGTNGATFYITGVQLEAGTVATPFERRSYGQELALCQRYYEEVGAFLTGMALNTTTLECQIPFQQKRTNANVGQISGRAARIRLLTGTADFFSTNPVVANATGGNNQVWTQVQNFSGLAANYPATGRGNGDNFIFVNAEL